MTRGAKAYVGRHLERASWAGERHLDTEALRFAGFKRIASQSERRLYLRHGAIPAVITIKPKR